MVPVLNLGERRKEGIGKRADGWQDSEERTRSVADQTGGEWQEERTWLGRKNGGWQKGVSGKERWYNKGRGGGRGRAEDALLCPPSPLFSSLLTEEIIRCELVVVPQLQGEARGHWHHSLAQTVEVLFLPNNHDLLWRKVLKRADHSPVEVAFSIQWAVVDVCLLSLILTSKPTVWAGYRVDVPKYVPGINISWVFNCELREFWAIRDIFSTKCMIMWGFWSYTP